MTLATGGMNSKDVTIMLRLMADPRNQQAAQEVAKQAEQVAQRAWCDGVMTGDDIRKTWELWRAGVTGPELTWFDEQ